MLLDLNLVEEKRREEKTLLMCRSRIAWAKAHTNFSNRFWGKVLQFLRISRHWLLNLYLSVREFYLTKLTHFLLRLYV